MKYFGQKSLKESIATWEKARMNCKELNSDAELFYFNNIDEYKEITNLLIRTNSPITSLIKYYIGLKFNKTSNFWILLN
jgi:hypothetical protein